MSTPASPPDRTRVAACFHGFLRTGASMWWVRRHLVAHGWARVDLPTFVYQAGSLDQHAQAAAGILRDLSDAHDGAPVDLVTHSMGGLLARAVLRHDAPIHRVVMLAPPNQGAWMAEVARQVLPVHQLGWDPLAPLLPGAPAELPGGEAAEIGILTGGSGDSRGLIQAVPDDNDGRVRVEEARLDGAREFRVVPYGHATIMMRQPVLELVVNFLDHGRFDGPEPPPPGY